MTMTVEQERNRDADEIMIICEAHEHSRSALLNFLRVRDHRKCTHCLEAHLQERTMLTNTIDERNERIEELQEELESRKV